MTTHDLKTDRRSQRTRRALGEALTTLMRQKPFSAITVQDILERANVGRTTFYAHFLDKEDLLMKEFQRVVHELDRATLVSDPAAAQLLPSLALFQHVKEFQAIYKALTFGRGLELIYKHFLAQLSAFVELRLAQLAPAGRSPKVPLPLLAHWLAGTFLSLLTWWLDHKMVDSPEHMDALFWQIARPSVSDALDITL